MLVIPALDITAVCPTVMVLIGVKLLIGSEVLADCAVVPLGAVCVSIAHEMHVLVAVLGEALFTADEADRYGREKIAFIKTTLHPALLIITNTQICVYYLCSMYTYA